MNIKINDKIINLDKCYCVNITSTLIEFCNSEQASDKISYNRGIELTANNFDMLKLWVETNIDYHQII